MRKKIISLFLSLLTVLGVMSVGLTAWAETPSGVKSFSKLSESCSDFVYFATEYYDAEGNVVEDNDKLDQGEELTVKFYVKSDMPVYSFSCVLLYENALVDVDKGQSKATTNPDKILCDVDNDVYTDSDYTWYDFDTEKGELTEEFALQSGLKKEDVIISGKDEEVLKYEFVTLYNKNTTKGTTIKYMNTTSDDALYQYTVTVKEDATLGKEIKAFTIPSLYSCVNENGKEAVCPVAVSSSGNCPLFDSGKFMYEGLNHSFVINDKTLLSFTNGEEDVVIYHKPGEEIKVPSSFNAFAWYNSDDGKKTFVDFDKEKDVNRPTLYKAVMPDEMVRLTINPNGGTFADGTTETKRIMVKISKGFDPADYPVTYKDSNVRWASLRTGDNVKNEQTIDGKFSFPSPHNYTVKAYWENDIVIKVPNIKGEWVDFKKYAGITDSVIGDTDIIAIQKIIDDNYDELTDLVGYEPCFVDFASQSTKTLGTTAGWTYFGRTAEAPCSGAEFYNEKRAEYAGYDGVFTFGKDTCIYLHCKIGFEYNAYAPVLDEDLNPVYSETGKFGKLWNPKPVYSEFQSYIPGDFSTFSPDKLLFLVRESDLLFDYNTYSNTTDYKTASGDTLEYDTRTKLYTHGRISDAENNVINVYLNLQPKQYKIKIAYNTNASLTFSNLISFGDVISRESLVLPGDRQFEDLINGNCYRGYKLTKLYTETSDIMQGDTIAVNKTLIDKYCYYDKVSDVFFIKLPAEWEALPYHFTVYYKDANLQYKVLTESVLFGNERISYSKLITTDLQKVLDEDCHESLSSAFTLKDKDGNSVDSKEAYACPSDIYVDYVSSYRYFYTITNPKNIQRNTVRYGTCVYDKDFVIGTDTESAPKLNAFLNAFNPESNPEKIQKTDADGNLVYEYLMQDKVDEKGNVVIDYVTGKPVREYVLDEFGSKVYDVSKPVYRVDAKGGVDRPYHDCEYIGYKFYLVDGCYSEKENLPAKSEWKEISEDEVSGYELTDTLICEIQWKSDADFLLRIYDDAGNIFSALGKNLKWYHWKGNKPCQKGEGSLVSKPENILLMMRPHIETVVTESGSNKNTLYFKAFSISKENLNPTFIPLIIPMIVNLIKGLI